MTHGERVKVIRNSLGLTLQSFGRPLGVIIYGFIKNEFMRILSV